MNQYYEYDIALSFAGEDRLEVEKVAEALKARGISVFYDAYEEAKLWGENLYESLIDIYQNKARYTLIFISVHYKNKIWTKHELRAAQVRAIEENHGYILPVKIDDTEIDSIPCTIGFIDLRKRSPVEVAVLICQKLGCNPFETKAHAVPSPKSDSLSSEVKFNYSSYNGRYCIGSEPYLFETKWSKASNTNIHCYNDPSSIRGIALVSIETQLNEITNSSNLDFTSRCRTPKIGQYVILQNSHGFYAALKILGIKDDTRGDETDELTFRYWILADGSDNFSNISEI